MSGQAEARERAKPTLDWARCRSRAIIVTHNSLTELEFAITRALRKTRNEALEDAAAYFEKLAMDDTAKQIRKFKAIIR